jgi:hypothetical protein
MVKRALFVAAVSLWCLGSMCGPGPQSARTIEINRTLRNQAAADFDCEVNATRIAQQEDGLYAEGCGQRTKYECTDACPDGCKGDACADKCNVQCAQVDSTP